MSVRANFSAATPLSPPPDTQKAGLNNPLQDLAMIHKSTGIHACITPGGDGQNIEDSKLFVGGVKLC